MDSWSYDSIFFIQLKILWLHLDFFRTYPLRKKKEGFHERSNGISTVIVDVTKSVNSLFVVLERSSGRDQPVGRRFARVDSRRRSFEWTFEGESLACKTYFWYDQLNSRTSIGAPGGHFHHETFETFQNEFCSFHDPRNRHFLQKKLNAFIFANTLPSHFSHFMREQKWQCQCGHIVFAAFLQNIPQAKDCCMSRGDLWRWT